MEEHKCHWLVLVRYETDDPDWYPDSESDMWVERECGGKTETIVRNGQEVGWRCNHGHRWVHEEYKTAEELYEDFLQDMRD